MAKHPLPNPEELRAHFAEMRGVVSEFVANNQSEKTPEPLRGKGIVLVYGMHPHVKANITTMYAAEACAASGSKAPFVYTMEADDTVLAKINPEREKRFRDFIQKNPDLQTNNDSLLRVPAMRVAVLATTIPSQNPLPVFEHGFLSTLGKVEGADPLWSEIDSFGAAETFSKAPEFSDKLENINIREFSDDHENAMVNALAEKAQKGMVFTNVGALHAPIVVAKLHAMGIPVLAINAAGKLPQTTDATYDDMVDTGERIRFERLRAMQPDPAQMPAADPASTPQSRLVHTSTYGLVYTPKFGADEEWVSERWSREKNDYIPGIAEPDPIESFKRAMKAMAQDMTIPEMKNFYLEKLDKHVPSPPTPQTAPQIETGKQKQTPDGAGIMNLVPPDVVTNFQQLNTDHAMASIPPKTAALGVQKSTGIA